MRKNILVTIADGFHFRYLIDTGILKQLSKNHDIFIVTIPHLVNEVIAYSDINTLNFQVFEQKKDLNILKNTLASIYKKIISKSSKKLSETINIKNEINNKSRTKIFDYIFQIISNIKPLRVIIIRITSLAFLDFHVRNLFLKCKIHFLITSTPGQKDFDLPFLYMSNKMKIDSVCPVYSWDNLTAKGPFFLRPTYLIVWNEIMKKEALYYHNYDFNKVFACGVPVFDLYPAIIKNGLDKKEFLKSLNLNDSSPIITIATIPQIYFGENHLKLAKLILNERGKRLPYFQLLIRPHPMDETNYNSLNNINDVFVDEYGSKPDKSLERWKPNKDNILRLGQTMKYSNIVINIASTITIDAACFDTPIINIAFDLKNNESEYLGSIKRYYGYTHYKHVLESGAAYLSENFQQLIEALNIYLIKPDLQRTERKALVKNQALYLDGKSSMRISEKLISLIKNNEENRN